MNDKNVIGEEGLERILSSLFDKIRELVRSETVVGKPIEVGKSYIIPFAKIKVGFMAGSRSSNQLGASGGAVTVDPVGVLVIADEGKVFFYSTGKPPSSIVEKAINLIPEVADKILPEIKSRLTKSEEKPKEQKSSASE